jgi:gamma-glutamylaminecyclotransferase
MTAVFVYGTLKRGGQNHHFLAGQQFLGPARTAAGFTLYSLGEFPGMVRTPASDRHVVGEVWEVDAPALAALDALEGIAEGLYERVTVPLESPFNDRPVETYLYLRTLAGRPEIGADWRQ